MDLLKNILTPIIMVVVLHATGLLLLSLRKKQTLAKFLLSMSIVCLCFFSLRPVSNLLLWGLERQYPPIIEFGDLLSNIGNIVVLTAWDSNNPTVPDTSNIGYRSALRVLEAHRIFMHTAKCKIVISGSNDGSRLMRELMLLLDVPAERIVIDQPENTWESASHATEFVSDQPFFLVTSAIHLPRSMFCFTKEGLRPIPAPADFSYGYYQRFKVPFRPFSYYLPNVDSLMKSTLALYEYLGLCWYYVKAQTIS